MASPAALLSALFFMAGFQMRLQGQLINPYLRSIGFTGSDISAITASSRVTSMMSPLLVGWLPNTVMSANVFVGLVYLLTCPLLLVRWGMPLFWPIFAAKTLLGTMGVVFSWTNVVVFTHANTSFPRIRMFNAVGCLAGSLTLSYYLRWREAAIPAGDQYALSRVLAEPQLAGAISAVATGIFCLVCLPHTPPPAPPSGPQKASGLRAMAARVSSARAVMGKQLKVEGFGALLALSGSVAFTREFVNQYALIALGEAAGLQPSAVNLAMGVWQIAEMLVASQLQAVLQRVGPRGAICLGLAAEVLREVLCANAASVRVAVLVAGQALGGVSMALYDATVAMEGNRLRHASKDRGTPQLMLKTADAMGLAGTLLAGWMYDAVGPGGAFALPGPAAPTGLWEQALGLLLGAGPPAQSHRNWAVFFLPPAGLRLATLAAFWLAYRPRAGGFVEPKPAGATKERAAARRPPAPASPPRATDRVLRSTPRKSYH